MLSIVVPAHNEAGVIERGLTAMLEGHEPGELEVVVVANGCTDDTAARARRAGASVRVIELSRPSKSEALARGDAEARGFPRFFVDADVVLPLAAIREVARVLERGPAQVAAPRMRVDLRAASAAVRAYYRVWMQLPYHSQGTIGSGVYALSEAGRGRFETFPDIISDDGYVRLLFAPGERASVEGAEFTITAPRTLGGVLAVKTRSQKGWLQLKRTFPELLGNDPRDYGHALAGLAQNPLNWPGCVVYGFVIGITKFRAWRMNRSGQLADWERDDSSRPDPTRAAPAGLSPAHADDPKNV